MSRRELLGFAAVACVACCIGPIVGVLAAITALGVAASVLVGFAGVVIAATASAAFVIVRRRRSNACRTEPDPDPAPVELTRPSR